MVLNRVNIRNKIYVLTIYRIKNYLHSLFNRWLNNDKIKNEVVKINYPNNWQPNYIAIGEKVRKTREDLNWTQEALAEKTGLSAVHISNIETAHTKVSLPALIIIANALGTSLDVLACDDLDNVYEIRAQQHHDIISDCTPKEARIINDTISTLKRSLKKNK